MPEVDERAVTEYGSQRLSSITACYVDDDDNDDDVDDDDDSLYERFKDA